MTFVGDKTWELRNVQTDGIRQRTVVEFIWDKIAAGEHPNKGVNPTFAGGGGELGSPSNVKPGRIEALGNRLGG